MEITLNSASNGYLSGDDFPFLSFSSLPSNTQVKASTSLQQPSFHLLCSVTLHTKYLCGWPPRTRDNCCRRMESTTIHVRDIDRNRRSLKVRASLSYTGYGQASSSHLCTMETNEQSRDRSAKCQESKSLPPAVMVIPSSLDCQQHPSHAVFHHHSNKTEDLQDIQDGSQEMDSTIGDRSQYQVNHP